jgi:hypothetical protein
MLNDNVRYQPVHLLCYRHFESGSRLAHLRQVSFTAEIIYSERLQRSPSPSEPASRQSASPRASRQRSRHKSSDLQVVCADSACAAARTRRPRSRRRLCQFQDISTWPPVRSGVAASRSRSDSGSGCCGCRFWPSFRAHLSREKMLTLDSFAIYPIQCHRLLRTSNHKH